MNSHRAKEIMESPDTISVTYQGQQIYIQNVNDMEETARIYPLDHPEEEKDVPLNALHEEQVTRESFNKGVINKPFINHPILSIKKDIVT